MLFFKSKTVTQNKEEKRKEKNSFLANRTIFQTSIITSKQMHRASPSFCEKRASLCASGSITVEASLAIPIFFLALICMIYLMEILSVQMCIRVGMHSALDSIVSETVNISYMSASEIEDKIIEAIGSEKLEQSIVINGAGGLDCSESQISVVTGLITLQVSYGVELPIPQFGSLGLWYQEEMIAKAWTGYEATVLLDEEEVVYITDTSSVYHVDASCTHLVLDISSASASGLNTLRNEYGGSYAACSKCISSENQDEISTNGMIYIASTGTHYHSSLSCSGLTRTVYTIPLSEAIGMGVCSRCGAY